MNEGGAANSAQANFDAEPLIWNTDSSVSAATYIPAIEIASWRFSREMHDLVPETEEEECIESIEIDEVDTTTSAPQAIMQNQQPLLEAGFSKKTYERILSLAYTNQVSKRPLNPVSLNDFLSFWREVRSEAVEPELFLSPNGYLQAEWYKNRKHRVIIEFAIPFALCIFVDGQAEWKKRERIKELAQSLFKHSSSPLKWL